MPGAWWPASGTGVRGGPCGTEAGRRAAGGLRRPRARKESEIAICPRFAVAFQQRHSEAFGGPTLGYRSRDAIGQSSAWLRGGRAWQLCRV